MPNPGDYFIIQLKEPHLMWGEFHPSRHSHSRREIYGEGYIPIPANVAYRFGIFNKSNPFGISPIYYCMSYDNYYHGRLLAQVIKVIPTMQNNLQKKET